MQREYIFVYGTLRCACATGAHQTYLANAEFIDTAKVKGSLYRVSYYPALVLDSTADWVIGEVYQLTSAAQLTQLDVYEECTYPSLPEQEYQRTKINVTTDSGVALSAWVYAFQQATSGLTHIASGDFLTS
jgi:gamma-glutamylcyclotransferase (GGCT)/AIG2-like uncharacterized protein YtfP